MKPAMPAVATEIPITIQNPYGEPEKGRLVKFIPNNPEKIVGIAIKIVIDVNNFITILRLFDISEANASIVPLKIPL